MRNPACWSARTRLHGPTQLAEVDSLRHRLRLRERRDVSHDRVARRASSRRSSTLPGLSIVHGEQRLRERLRLRGVDTARVRERDGVPSERLHARLSHARVPRGRSVRGERQLRARDVRSTVRACLRQVLALRPRGGSLRINDAHHRCYGHRRSNSRDGTRVRPDPVRSERRLRLPARLGVCPRSCDRRHRLRRDPLRYTRALLNR